MIIEHAQRSNTVNQFKGFHCVCIAENGFSMINQYAGHLYGVSHEVIREFCESVNRRNEMGSLYPLAPVSALPSHFVREWPSINDSESQSAKLQAFSKEINAFLMANHQTLHADRIAVDLRVSPEPIPADLVRAFEAAVSTSPYASHIQKFVLVI